MLHPYPRASLLTLTLVALLEGCGGCSGTANPPPQSPPKPVQGNAPQAKGPAAAPPAAAPVQEARDACALLIFSSVDGGPAPLSAQLTAEGDCTKGTARFEWDFGDGSPKATGDTVVHTYEKAGTYTVKARITSDELPGLEDVDDVEIVVTSPSN